MWLLPGSAPVAAADTWTPGISGTTNDLRSVTAVDTNTAWAVGSGGTILKTNNCGATWDVAAQQL